MKFLKRAATLLIVLAIGWLAWSYWPVHVDIDYSGPTAIWPDYGNDRGGSRFSPLDQITKENVEHLQVAWRYHHGDVSRRSEAIPTTTAFEATPILVNETLYFPTPFNRVIALDPETGEERWAFDPELDLSGKFANQLICRGVTYWEDTALDTDPKRIFMGTNDARLICLNADTGEPCAEFGEDGQLVLSTQAGEAEWYGEYQITSPPAIVDGVVIVGSAVCDSVRLNAPSGVVRAFDARTGAPAWDWDLRPPDYDPPPEMLSDAGYMLGTPNVWAPMSVDEERGLVYVPTGNPAPDYWVATRNGADYYGSSVVALRGKTGEIAWHFQTVHHDMWDYDVPAQPTLFDLERDGEIIPALVQATKMGFLFVLNRETGEPIYGVEERPVPQTTVPGEISSPTQPFPILPPPIAPAELTPDDAWGVFSSDIDACREWIEASNFEGRFTPAKLGEPTIHYPGVAGGSNWGGVSVDPERQILIARSTDMPFVITLVPRDELEDWQERYPRTEFGAQEGAPYALMRQRLMSPLELPCNPPPWGMLTGVDLKTGEFAWQRGIGTIRDLAPVPLPIELGVPGIGGPLTTSSGITFLAATVDNYLRAIDTETGEELWKGRLPAGGQATPMTYRLHEDSKQYVVIAAGGHGRAGTKLGDTVMAFALPG